MFNGAKEQLKKPISSTASGRGAERKTKKEQLKRSELARLRPVYNEEGEITPTFLQTRLQRLDKGVGAIEAATSRTQQQMHDYAEEISSLKPYQKEIEDFEKYSSKALDPLTMAFDHTLLLQARIRAFRS
ncbi:hypothetical protein COOONC_27587 [Cooperia oncophora]